jgi:hypothetical protein
MAGTVAVLVTGPSPEHPDDDHRLEFLRLHKGEAFGNRI